MIVPFVASTNEYGLLPNKCTHLVCPTILLKSTEYLPYSEGQVWLDSGFELARCFCLIISYIRVSILRGARKEMSIRKSKTQKL